MGWWNPLSWGKKRTDSQLEEAKLLEKLIPLLKSAHATIKKGSYSAVRGYTDLQNITDPLVNLERALSLLSQLEHKNKPQSIAIFKDDYLVSRNRYFENEIRQLKKILNGAKGKSLETNEFDKLDKNLDALIASMEMLFQTL